MLGTADGLPPSDAAALALTWANVAAKSKFKEADSCSVEDVVDADVLEACDVNDCSSFFSFNFV